MFGHRFFGARYFAPAYFGQGGGLAPPTPAPAPAPVPGDAGGAWRGAIDARSRRRRKRLEDDDQEIIAALKALAPDLLMHHRKDH